MSKVDQSEEDDGSQPLKNERWEKFAQNVANGMSLASAYALAGFKATTRNSLDANASALAKTPKVARRIAWLKVRNVSGAPLTKEEKISALEVIIRTGSDSDKLRAMAVHTEMTGDDKKEVVLSPDQVCEYLSSNEGNITSFLPTLRVLISWCGVDEPTVRQAVETIYGKAEPESAPDDGHDESDESQSQ